MIFCGDVLLCTVVYAFAPRGAQCVVFVPLVPDWQSVPVYILVMGNRADGV